MSPAWGGGIAGSTKVGSSPPPPSFHVFTVAKWQAGEKATTKKNKVVHTMAATWWTTTTLVFWIAIMCHIKDAMYSAGNLSLHSRSFQCLFSHGRPALPLSRQRCTACLKRLCGISFQRWMSWSLHLLAWPNVLFFVLCLIKGLK